MTQKTTKELLEETRRLLYWSMENDVTEHGFTMDPETAVAWKALWEEHNDSK